MGTKASRGTVGLEPNGDLAAVPSSFSWRGTCPARSQCAENAPRAGVDSAAARGHCGSTHRRAGLRSRKEREPMEDGSAVCCSGPHWQCQQRGVASARNTHCAPRRRSRTLRQTCPIRSPPVAAPRRRCPRVHTRKREATAAIRTVQETRETMKEAVHARACANACTAPRPQRRQRAQR